MNKKLSLLTKLIGFLFVLAILSSLGLTIYMNYYRNQLVESNQDISEDIGIY